MQLHYELNDGSFTFYDKPASVARLGDNPGRFRADAELRLAFSERRTRRDAVSSRSRQIGLFREGPETVATNAVRA